MVVTPQTKWVPVSYIADIVSSSIDDVNREIKYRGDIEIMIEGEVFVHCRDVRILMTHFEMKHYHAKRYSESERIFEWIANQVN